MACKLLINGGILRWNNPLILTFYQNFLGHPSNTILHLRFLSHSFLPALTATSAVRRKPFSHSQTRPMFRRKIGRVQRLWTEGWTNCYAYNSMCFHFFFYFFAHNYVVFFLIVYVCFFFRLILRLLKHICFLHLNQPDHLSQLFKWTNNNFIFFN